MPQTHLGSWWLHHLKGTKAVLILLSAENRNQLQNMDNLLSLYLSFTFSGKLSFKLVSGSPFMLIPSSQSQFMQRSHISFQFLPAGSIKIKLGWKYHHSKCLAIFTTWRNISLWAFGAIQSSKDYLCTLVNHLCKLSEHALVDYE